MDIDYSSASSRELDFPNILTIHDGQVNTWSSVSKVIAKHTFKADANVAAVSFSGHYGFFDNASFVVQMINMQSGLLRSKFVGHTQRITGIACDNLDSTVYTTSLDGDLRIWDLNTGKAITTLWMNQPIYHLRVHTETRLAALALEDSIKILDLKTEKTIRLFANTPHTNAIVISPNAKLCISSHSDKTIRIHDIPSGSLIDWVLMEQEIVCLDFDRILVASGKSSRAIYMLEVNENQGRGHVINPLTDIPTGFDESIEIIDMSEEENSIFETSVAQLSDDLVTCSLEPRIKWNTLKDLDTIKVSYLACQLHVDHVFINGHRNAIDPQRPLRSQNLRHFSFLRSLVSFQHSRNHPLSLMILRILLSKLCLEPKQMWYRSYWKVHIKEANVRLMHSHIYVFDLSI